MTPSFSSSLTSLFCSFLHLRYFVYNDCTGFLHHHSTKVFLGSSYIHTASTPASPFISTLPGSPLPSQSDDPYVVATCIFISHLMDYCLFYSSPNALLSLALDQRGRGGTVLRAIEGRGGRAQGRGGRIHGGEDRA